jgi:hypothetical protein
MNTCQPRSPLASERFRRLPLNHSKCLFVVAIEPENEIELRTKQPTTPTEHPGTVPGLNASLGLFRRTRNLPGSPKTDAGRDAKISIRQLLQLDSTN